MADTTNTDTTAASGAASQPEALRLAEKLERYGALHHELAAAAELRRLHALTTAAPAAQEAEPAVGFWQITENSGTHGWRSGWYVFRDSPSGREWLKDEKRRIAHFATRRLAERAVARADATSRIGHYSTAAPRPQADAGAAPDWDALRHSANEWADMATNGLQWMRNVVDGTSDPKDALANLERNLAHCRAVNDAPSVQSAVRVAAAPQAPAAPTAAAASDEDEALDLLDALFAAWEDGTPCYDEPDSAGSFLGNAFRLDDATFHRCVELLERRRSRQISATPAPAAGAAPSESDDACAWTVWWTHHKARYTTPRQAALAAWTAAIGRERAAAPAQEAEDAARLTEAELREVQLAVDDFEDCGETDVDYNLLLRAAVAGYLECTRFQVLNQSALDLDAARARQEGSAA